MARNSILLDQQGSCPESTIREHATLLLDTTTMLGSCEPWRNLRWWHVQTVGVPFPIEVAAALIAAPILRPPP
jgi:hypothetical protein